MSRGQFQDIDLDLLADYVGGALDGTPEQGVVARLIADEPEWAEAHAALVAATERVHDCLVAWGSEEVVMPADVTARLTDALAAVGDADRGAVQSPPRLPAQPRRTTTAPDDRSSTGRRPAGRRRRVRWAHVGVIAAAAVVVGVGVGSLDPFTTGSSELDSQSIEADGSATPAAALVPPPADHIVASQTRYLRTNLSEAADSPTTVDVGPLVLHATTDRPLPVVPGLERLADDDDLTACLSAVAAAHPAPVTVELVDYAAFESEPALILVFTDGDGTRWVWAVGPGCGQVDADTRHRTRVG
ncbi:MAG TPA: hypothetical protein VF174_12800 [Micromonosporaceae bacterium]